MNRNDLRKKMIGVDGGGSKTEFVLFAEDGEIFHRFLADGCNLNNCGKEEACRLLCTGIDRLLTYEPEVCGIFIGAAGILSKEHGREIAGILKQRYPSIEIWCDNDILNIIAGQPDEEPCIAAICGTGGIVYTYAEEKLRRFGGWGYLLDKGGHGYGIGLDALRTALGQRDGIQQESLITSLVEKRLGTTVWESIYDIYNKGADYIASFAPLVFTAFEAGDLTAEKILKYHADCLCELIRHAANSCPGIKKVVLSGGIVSNSGYFLSLIQQKLSPDLTAVLADYPQIYGACARCRKLCNADADGFYEKFRIQYDALSKKKS